VLQTPLWQREGAGRRRLVPPGTTWEPGRARAAHGLRPRRDRPRRARAAAGKAVAHEKLSYTNLGFTLAPPTFTISELRELYAAALGQEVSATNLQRVRVAELMLPGRPSWAAYEAELDIVYANTTGYASPTGRMTPRTKRSTVVAT
jgi:hypothetical protein